MGGGLRGKMSFHVMNKSDVLLGSLTRFFDDPKNHEKLVDILEHRKGISLRKLKWFVNELLEEPTRHVYDTKREDVYCTRGIQVELGRVQ
jgi:hypothetical protein